MNNFVHLRTHTEFSLEQGIIKIPDLVKKAKEDNMAAVAISDNQGLFGVIKLFDNAKDNGIKPIVGSDLKIYDSEKKETYNMLFIAKNNEGYKQLMELISHSYEEKGNDDAVVLKEWIKPEYVPNLIVLSGAKEGNIGQAILNNDLNKATEEAQYWKDFFGDNFYIELQRDGKDNETQYMDGAVTVAQKLNIPVVATNPSVFLNQEDFLAHEAKICIKQGEHLYDLDRERKYNKENYFKTQSEMTELFADIPSAIENTVEIAKKCNLEITLGKHNLPVFETPNGESVEQYFENQIKDGLKRKLKNLYPDLDERKTQAPKYVERLTTEMDTIKKMGFVDYFLIVSDFIKWAKENGIPVGPGRGSGAGSLVAYCLDIIDVDPLKYDLLFERFLNPERVSMPDFDIDFCSDRRGEVIDYVIRKYGKDKVSQIGTINTLGARSAIRDVGRILNYPQPFIDSLAKAINPSKGNEKMSLAEYIETDAAFKDKIKNDPEVKKLIEIALKLDGLTRQIGKHAGGVLISPTKITDFSALYQGNDNEGVLVSQFDKEDIEKAGLVKFDFLALAFLTQINNCVELVNKKPEFRDNPLDISKISYDSPEAYKLLQEGKTKSIFQLEARPVTELCKKIKPSNLEDIIALNALNRPGPLGSGMVDIYIERKHGREQIDYLHPSLKEILEPTYGVIVYQEQVMKIAQELAGYTFGSADLLRRAMGKKKPEEMAAQKQIFIDGAKKKHNVPKEQAESIFELIQKFAEYGFNKSHSAGYAILSYQTAYLKANHPHEFFIASLNSSLEDTNHIHALIDDAKANGIEILPPDINKSSYYFTHENGKIRYGLGGLKSIGFPIANAIEKARREKGEFVDVMDFLDKTSFSHYLEKVSKPNKRNLETLIMSGAFDSTHPNRAELFNFIDKGIDYVNQLTKHQQKVDSPLYELFGNKNNKVAKFNLDAPKIEPAEDWEELQKLQNEISAFGFYFSSSLFNGYAKKLGGLPSLTELSVLPEKFQANNKQKVLIAGIISDVIPFSSGKGARINIMDNNNNESLVIFKDAFDANRKTLNSGQFATFLCNLQPDKQNDGHSLLVDAVFDFDKTFQITVDKVFAALDDEKSIEQQEKIKALCSLPENQGEIELTLCGLNPETGRKNLVLETYNVNCNETLMKELNQICGEKWVKSSFKNQINLYPLTPKKNYNNKKTFSA